MSATAKHQPATPLPWNMQDGGRSNLAHVEREDNGEQVCSINKRRVADAAYIAHAANAYPKLVHSVNALIGTFLGEAPRRLTVDQQAALDNLVGTLLEFGE